MCSCCIWYSLGKNTLPCCKNKVHFDGQPQILFKGIWGMYKGTEIWVISSKSLIYATYMGSVRRHSKRETVWLICIQFFPNACSRVGMGSGTPWGPAGLCCRRGSGILAPTAVDAKLAHMAPWDTKWLFQLHSEWTSPALHVPVSNGTLVIPAELPKGMSC